MGGNQKHFGGNPLAEGLSILAAKALILLIGEKRCAVQTVVTFYLLIAFAKAGKHSLIIIWQLNRNIARQPELFDSICAVGEKNIPEAVAVNGDVGFAVAIVIARNGQIA